MSFFAKFRNVEEADKSKAVQKLIEDSTPDYDFFVLTTLAVVVATMGLLLDSAAVVIGSMLIAPVLYPFLSLSLGMVMSDFQLMARSVYTVLKSFGIGLLAAVLVTFLFAPNYKELTFELFLRSDPSLLSFMVAVVSGVAVAFALVRPQLNETLPGTAVSVALIPPLATTGVGLAWLNFELVAGSLVLLLINVVGIVFASLVSFSLLNLYVKRHVAKQAVIKEEIRVEKEEQEAEQIKQNDRLST